MKLVIKILLISEFFLLSLYSIAQVKKTEVIIETQIAVSKIYLAGKLLNVDKLNFTFNDIKNNHLQNIDNKFLYAKIVNNISKFRDYKMSLFPNTLSKNIFRNKVYSNIQFDFTNENEKELFYDKPLFKILLGGFVALGAATAYFKIKADRKFADYKKSNNQALLDDTNKFDAISGVAFTLMEINFGILVYYFLRD